MDTETKTVPKIVEIDSADVFILVLMPSLPAFGVDNPLDIQIAGRSIIGWIDSVIEPYASAKVVIQKSDDIMSIVRANLTAHKYTVIVYADTPLITRGTVEQAVSYAGTFGHKACKMPRGWVFETASIKNSESIEAVEIPNLPDEDFIVAYNYTQVALIGTIVRGRINAGHLRKGVYIIDPANAYIDADAVIGKGTKIGPGVLIRGNSKIGKNCRITNSVEIKNSVIGDGTKIAHMSYVGDATMGENCNIGCGVVFCSYNGKVKNKTVLGDGVFVGSNCNLIAPLKLGDNSYIAAGSTIAQDVPSNSLGIARARQAVKENWSIKDDAE